MLRAVRALSVLLFSLLVITGPNAAAQTRYSVEAAALMPYGDFGDAVDPSAWIGARAEFQAVNAIDQVAPLSWVIQGGYSDLQVDGPGDLSGSVWTIGAGVRVYSSALPFFLHGGVEFLSTQIDVPVAANADPVEADGNVFGPTIGAGLRFDLEAAFIEVEGRLHAGLTGGDDDVEARFVTLGVALGLPF